MEPDWYSARTFWLRNIDLPEEHPFKGLDGYRIPALDGDKPTQEEYLIKQLFLDIAQYGLNYAYKEWTEGKMRNPDEKWKFTKTANPKKVIVVGAGMSGLCAGYELAQAGHQIEILEIEDHVGGRVETVREPFSRGLFTEAGAMRIPGDPADVLSRERQTTPHFITDFYASDCFKLSPEKFINSCNKCFLSLPGCHKMTLDEWKQDPTANTTRFWPEWDKNLNNDIRRELSIVDIDSYFVASLSPVLEVLRRSLAAGRTVTDGCKHAWSQWMETWSDMSVLAFLRCKPEVDLQAKFSNANSDLLDQLSLLLPWTEDAIAAHCICKIPFPLTWSITFIAPYCVNEFWLNPMHTYEGGLQNMAEKFLQMGEYSWNKDTASPPTLHLEVCVHQIKYDASSVTVLAYDKGAQKDIQIMGDAVIITAPIVKLKNIDFLPPIPMECNNCISSVKLTSNCKVLMECKTRFWDKYGINGGATKIIYSRNKGTSQLVYPNIAETDDGDEEDGGILMAYIWPPFADRYANTPKKDVLEEIVGKMSSLHPELREEFKQGTVHVFADAFSINDPSSYPKASMLMNANVNKKIYFAGEWLSAIPGWIEGALQSGLKAAFQFYFHNENLANSR